MKAKEAAEWIMQGCKGEDLAMGAELLARHVLAQETDPDLQMAVGVERLTELQTTHTRYELLLEQINAADPDGRTILERALDTEADRRSSRIIRLDS